MPQSIYVVGPTASGKSDLAIALAKKFNGEVISADSRQIYRGLDIGSGKEPGKLMTNSNRGSATQMAYMIDGVPHYMIDTHHPRTVFSAGGFVKKASKIRDDIWKREKIPIICGGTMFWAQALYEGATFAHVKPNTELRSKLAKKSTETLLLLLAKKDSRRAKDIQKHNDQNNRPRLMRAIEIASALGSVPVVQEVQHDKDALILVINPEPDVLHKRIEKRMTGWFNDGIFKEVRNAHFTMHVPWVRLESFGLEYKWCTQHIRGLIDFETMRGNTFRDLCKYAKRQRTWIRRWEKSGAQLTNITTKKEASSIVKNFLQKKTTP